MVIFSPIQALENRPAAPTKAVKENFQARARADKPEIEVLRGEHRMNIARFEPWTFVDLLRRDLDRLADPRRVATTDHDSVVDWAPAVDI